MRFVVWAIAVALLLPVICAAGGGDPKAELAKRIEMLDAATLKHDKKGVEAMFDADGVFVTPKGEAVGRSAYVGGWMNDATRFDSAKSTAISLRIFGDTAIEVGLFEAKGKEDGKPFHWRTQYTAVWIKKSGVWVVTSEQDYDLPTAK